MTEETGDLYQECSFISVSAHATQLIVTFLNKLFPELADNEKVGGALNSLADRLLSVMDKAVEDKIMKFDKLILRGTLRGKSTQQVMQW